MTHLILPITLLAELTLQDFMLLGTVTVTGLTIVYYAFQVLSTWFKKNTEPVEGNKEDAPHIKEVIQLQSRDCQADHAKLMALSHETSQTLQRLAEAQASLLRTLEFQMKMAEERHKEILRELERNRER